MSKIVHRKAGDKNPSKNKINITTIVFSIIHFIFLLILLISIIKLNILPFKYLILIVFILFILNLFAILLISRRKKVLQVCGYILSIVILIISCLGIYYIVKTNSFLDKAFGNGTNTYTNTFYVIVDAESKYSEIDDIADGEIGYYDKIPNIEDAIDKLLEVVTIDTKSYDDILSNFNDLRKNKIDATVIEQGIYESIIDSSVGVIDDSDYKIIYTFELTIEEEVEEIVDDGHNFSIYIGGADFTEKNNDFNMVVTINKKTHKILLTSIPRDYYVYVEKYGMYELLGYVGYSGINTSREAMETLFETNIDYYMKINTNSIVGLVDTLGGVQFCNEGKTFTTTHALVQGTYDDTKGKKLTVPSGCRNYSGIEILTIVRERKAFADGDRQRQRNCQQVIINIFKKMASSNMITNYSNVLNSVSDLYTTNISRDMITELANDTINGASWTFEQQSVTGYDSSGYVHLGTVKDYVMHPDTDSINTAIANIKKIKAGK